MRGRRREPEHRWVLAAPGAQFYPPLGLNQDLACVETNTRDCDTRVAHASDRATSIMVNWKIRAQLRPADDSTIRTAVALWPDNRAAAEATQRSYRDVETRG